MESSPLCHAPSPHQHSGGTSYITSIFQIQTNYGNITSGSCCTVTSTLPVLATVTTTTSIPGACSTSARSSTLTAPVSSTTSGPISSLGSYLPPSTTVSGTPATITASQSCCQTPIIYNLSYNIHSIATLLHHLKHSSGTAHNISTAPTTLTQSSAPSQCPPLSGTISTIAITSGVSPSQCSSSTV